jgi:hypothetical protein
MRKTVLTTICLSLIYLMSAAEENRDQMNNDFMEIISYAAKAPSGHNTQPWRFSLTGNTISIKPNFEVALPVVDGDNREFYISLGCATENLLIASAHFGYEVHIVQCDTVEIKVELTKGKQVVKDTLFHQIERRQTNRSVYSGKKIDNEQIEKLQSVSQSDNLKMYCAEIDSPLADTLTQYIARGNEMQMSDKAFREELLSWMRFNGNQVKKMGDGLSNKALGTPSLPGVIAKPIVRQFLKPDTQNKGDMKKIASSSHLVLFTTKHNTTKEWIDLGRLLQRFCLTTTESGIASAYCNQPCEVVSLANELQKTLPINGEYPTLIQRIGYADPMPYSPRKKLTEVVE